MNLFGLVRDTGLVTVAGLWLGSTMWLYRDAKARLVAPRGAGLLGVAGLLLPFVAPLVYAFVRPVESRGQRRERLLARRLLEGEDDVGERCLACRTPLSAAFLRCPGCGDELRRPCPDCRTLLRLHWAACPHCECRVAPPLRAGAAA